MPGENCHNNSSDSPTSDVAGLQQENPGCISLTSPIAPPNRPPDTPSVPEGSVSGVPGSNYTYSTSAVDPEGDRVQISIDWGDGSITLVGFVDSGCPVSINHSWSRAGMYWIKVKASDHNGTTSLWSSPRTISMNTPPNPPSQPQGPSSASPLSPQVYNLFAIDADGDQLNYTIDWGDDSTSLIGPAYSGRNTSATHIWNRAGSYLVRAIASDRRGGTSPWSEPLMVIINSPPNRPSPPSGPESGEPGMLYDYVVSTTDPDGDPVQFQLDWGDQTSATSNLTETGRTSLNHSWSSAGIYFVKVRACDTRGAISDWSESLMIRINSPPARPSTSSGPAEIYARASFSYFSSATDPDGDPLRYAFDWGDGNISFTSLCESGSNASAAHSWSIGSYQLRARATDSRGASSPWSDALNITVLANDQPQAPLNLFGPSSGYKGLAHSYFTLATDPDKDNVTYTFDWGDGTNSTTQSVESGSVENAEHTWKNPGTYDVKACATDSKGASSPWSQFLIVSIADNHPPNAPAPPSGPASGRPMTIYKYATSANDPDGDQVKYVFDWGDGTTSWTGFDFVDSGTGASMPHRWSRAGIYLVRAMSLDDKGASSLWSKALPVNISSS